MPVFFEKLPSAVAIDRSAEPTENAVVVDEVEQLADITHPVSEFFGYSPFSLSSRSINMLEDKCQEIWWNGSLDGLSGFIHFHRSILNVVKNKDMWIWMLKVFWDQRKVAMIQGPS